MVTPQTDQGDLWIRSLESPAHDAIQPEQLPEPKQQQQAKTVFQNVRRQLRAIIDDEMQARHSEVSENLSELAQYLPENEGKECEEPSERHLAVTKIQTRPPDTRVLAEANDEEEAAGQPPDKGGSSVGPGNNDRVEGESGELRGRRRRAVSRIPVQDPRAIPLDSNRVRISFTPRLDGSRPIAVTIHPRGYEATVEAAIPISEAQCVSPGATACTLLEGGGVELTPDQDERISLLLTTSQPIERISAFDLLVFEAQ